MFRTLFFCVGAGSMLLPTLALMSADRKVTPLPKKSDVSVSRFQTDFQIEYPPTLLASDNPHSSGHFDFKIPVVNGKSKKLNFTVPIGSCGAVLRVNLAGRSGRESFACYWRDQDGWPYSATVRVDLCSVSEFSVTHLGLGVLFPGRSAYGSCEYREHAADENSFGAIPEWKCDRQNLKLAAGPPRIVKISNGLYRRIIPLTVAMFGIAESGYNSATVEPIGGGSKLIVDWTVRSPLRIEPPEVVLFGSVETKRFINIQNSSNQPVPLIDVHCDVPGIIAKVETGKVLVCIDWKDITDPKVRTVLRVRTRIPSEPTVQIPVLLFRVND
jgi:hypothetical protein